MSIISPYAPLMLNALNICESAAIAASQWTGRGDGKAADKAAVDAMRSSMNDTAMQGRIVIGEGERDKAPMLFIGEEVGTGEGDAVDIAVDPLEGTNLCADAAPGAIAVMAWAKRGNLLNAPDVYMEKIAIGAGFPDNLVSLEATPQENITALAKAKGCKPSDICVMVLDRPRHEELIENIRRVGARIILISDGDVAGIIATTHTDHPVDMYMGTGGAPEGVLAAVALRCTEGQMQGRLIFTDDAQCKRASAMGITDTDIIYSHHDMAQGDVLFVATGVTQGQFLSGVVSYPQHASTQSLIMCSASNTVKVVSNKAPVAM